MNDLVNGDAVRPCITRADVEAILDAGRIEVAVGNGKWWSIRRNGQTKTWKSQPGRIRIPYKYGFRGYGAITTWDFINTDGSRQNDVVRDETARLDPTQYRIKP